MNLLYLIRIAAPFIITMACVLIGHFSYPVRTFFKTLKKGSVKEILNLATRKEFPSNFLFNWRMQKVFETAIKKAETLDDFCEIKKILQTGIKRIENDSADFFEKPQRKPRKITVTYWYFELFPELHEEVQKKISELKSASEK